MTLDTLAPLIHYDPKHTNPLILYDPKHTNLLILLSLNPYDS
jgi:hypothetical protein